MPPPTTAAQERRRGYQGPKAAPTRISARELQVLQLVAEGLDDHKIAARLHMSRNTVKDHLGGLAQRWQCNRKRAALVDMGHRLGHLSKGDPA